MRAPAAISAVVVTALRRLPLVALGTEERVVFFVEDQPLGARSAFAILEPTGDRNVIDRDEVVWSIFCDRAHGG